METTVRPITDAVLGMGSKNGLVQQFIPSIPIIDAATFRPGDADNAPRFTSAPRKIARLGIFACQQENSVRSVILLMPQTGRVKNVMIGVSHRFGQNTGHYQGLGWSNPESPPLIQFVLLKHVINIWGAQVLTAPRPTALVHIVRAQGKGGGGELGPFSKDGKFTREAIEQMSKLTGDTMSLDSIQAFTFSNGIMDFNKFLKATSTTLNITRVVSIDPRYSIRSMKPSPSTVMRQYVSLQTGGAPGPEFEKLPFPRWKNEWKYQLAEKKRSKFQYLHNHTLPRYTLSLGLRK